MLDVFSHIYMCLCSRHNFQCMFFDSNLSIHVYLLDFRFTTDSLITIYITGNCTYLCAWTTSLWLCTRVLACTRHLSSFYVLAGLISDNLELSCPDPEAQQKHGGSLLWKSWTSSRSIGSAVTHSLPAPLTGSRDSLLWSVSIFQSFSCFVIILCAFLM